ncbi:MAG: hypothetical protein A3K00_00665 [Gallionellales bacterium RIFOXYD2_FULL_52_7]|nr:MAG: hypothetical protein A3K00_00665 [Gallionellales bacterium RIFOXYD2_FULL_52_7]
MESKPVEQQVGAVIIEMNWEATNKLKSGLLEISLWVTGGFLLLAVFLVHLASRRIIEPVTQLSAAIQAIGAGYLNTRVVVSDRISELNTLATGVNNMTVDLQQHYEHLEDLVRQRTVDLQQSDILTRHALGELQRQKYVIDKHAIVTICSVDGLITYCNDKFVEVSGYSHDDLIGQDHKVMNSGHHPKGFLRRCTTPSTVARCGMPKCVTWRGRGMQSGSILRSPHLWGTMADLASTWRCVPILRSKNASRKQHMPPVGPNRNFWLT